MSNRNLLEIYGPRAIVLGASEGIGRAFAETLAEKGFKLLLVARRDEVLEAAASRIRQIRAAATTGERSEEDSNGGVITLSLNLAEGNPWEKIQAALDGLDFGLVVYNAAASPVGSFLDLPLETLRRTVSVNILSPLDVLHFAGNIMRHRWKRTGKRGGVILMSSLSALRGTPRVSAYAATKAWNLVLAEAVNEEARTEGVDVMACIAGATDTPGYRDSLTGKGVGAPVQKPSEVAEESLNALGRRGSFIPGRLNRLVAGIIYGLIPRRWAIRILGRATSDLRFRRDAGMDQNTR